MALISSGSGDGKVFLLSMEGGEPHPLTKLSTGADLAIWSPDGKTIAFTSGVYPECKDDECNKKKDEEAGKNKVKAHVAEALLYRHWTHWNEGKRSHLFVVPADGSGVAKDLTAGGGKEGAAGPRGGGEGNKFFAGPEGVVFYAGDGHR